VEDLGRDVPGKQGIQQLSRLGLEDVLSRGLPMAVLPPNLFRGDRQEPLVHGPKGEGGSEVRVGRVHRVHLPFPERFDQSPGDLLGVLVPRHLTEAFPTLLDGHLPEPEVGLALATHHEGDRTHPLAAEPAHQPLRPAKDVGVVGPGQSPV
jgi:hypothetical protein